MHISSVATPAYFAFAFSSFMASSPKGVAALPAPKKFAAKFSVIGAIAPPALGKSRRRGFLIARESASISPALRAMPISPIHSI